MHKKIYKLSEISENQECVIIRINGVGEFHDKVMSLGFVPGEKLKVIKNAPLRDPIEYLVMNSHVSLRRSESEKIDVALLDDKQSISAIIDKYPYYGTVADIVSLPKREKTKNITVALAGNPNSGKTSVFNNSTGMRERVGNYSGVTVSSKVGVFHHKGYKISMVDLPGAYTIADNSPEEQYVRDFLLESHPDVVLNVIDCSNLERNLFLTTQIMDMNHRIVIALNMFDEFSKSGAKLDKEKLESILGVTCLYTVAKSGKGISKLLDSIIMLYEREEDKILRVNYGEDIEQAVVNVRESLIVDRDVAAHPLRYLAIKLLENEPATIKHISSHTDSFDKIKNIADKNREVVEKKYNDSFSTIITNAKYAFIRGVIKETVKKGQTKYRESAYKIDRILTSKWLGFPILICFLWIMFQSTFVLGAYPQEWIDIGMLWLAKSVNALIGDGILSDLLSDGIIAGVGGVLVFLPNIVILFFFISILEDTGYMARAAFITDRLMRSIGLHGRSIIPLLTGFGCSVPAIMATRTLEKPKDRIVTMMAIPFISCSARLPVYLLFVAAFFDSHQGIIILLIYLIGILGSVLTSLLLRHTRFKGDSEQFIIELPPYRIPSVRNVMVNLWVKSAHYLRKMGSVILFASIIIWMLNYFPLTDSKIESIGEQITRIESDNTLEDDIKQIRVANLQTEIEVEHNFNSYLGRMGRFIHPVFKPLGFDWEMGVSLLSGIAAKEIIVSSLGVLYRANAEDEHEIEKLAGALRSHVGEDGLPFITPTKAFAFMLFVLFSSPCIAAITAIGRESNWKWAVLAVFYTTGVAWLAAYVVYNVGSLFV